MEDAVSTGSNSDYDIDTENAIPIRKYSGQDLKSFHVNRGAVYNASYASIPATDLKVLFYMASLCNMGTKNWTSNYGQPCAPCRIHGTLKDIASGCGITAKTARLSVQNLEASGFIYPVGKIKYASEWILTAGDFFPFIYRFLQSGGEKSTDLYIYRSYDHYTNVLYKRPKGAVGKERELTENDKALIWEIISLLRDLGSALGASPLNPSWETPEAWAVTKLKWFNTLSACHRNPALPAADRLRLCADTVRLQVQQGNDYWVAANPGRDRSCPIWSASALIAKSETLYSQYERAVRENSQAQ